MRSVTRRKWGTGSVCQRKDGRWQASIVRGGKRVYAYGLTAEDAWGKLHLIKIRRRPLLMAERDRREDPLVAAARRVLRIEAVKACLGGAARQGWSPDYLAQVIVAQLTVTRIKAGVIGPCVYCGTWLANTVDHAIPSALGGSDRPSNLVSACFDCNTRKWKRRASDWPRASA